MRLSQAERREKLVDGDLLVHVWTPGGFLVAGVLELEEDGEEISARFSYAAGYLAHPGAYPLDPINLPLGEGSFLTTSQFVRLGAIFDAAPDAWGRRVVQAQLAEDARNRVFRGAFLRGADGIGAIVLTPQALAGEVDLDHIVSWSLQERPGVSQVLQAARAAADFEAGADLTDEMRQMLGGSWTIGGARPKAILRRDDDAGLPGESLIAKFHSRNDASLSRNRVEYASLRMAHDMGFRVPDHHLTELDGDGERRTALLLQRFDRNVVDGAVHRRHYVSAMSLISYQPQSKMLNSRMDQLMLSWSRLLDLASRVGEKPAAARVEMFARLCLNTALQNTDDHLKNFGFLRQEASRLHYEVAPVFDVSPQGAQRHYLHCADLGQTYSLKEVLSRGRALGVAKGAVDEIQDRLVGVLRNRAHYFDEAGLSAREASTVDGWIGQGLGFDLEPPTRESVRPASS